MINGGFECTCSILKHMPQGEKVNQQRHKKAHCDILDEDKFTSSCCDIKLAVLLHISSECGVCLCESLLECSTNVH